MITAEDKLRVFEDFMVDRSLPKYRRRSGGMISFDEELAMRAIVSKHSAELSSEDEDGPDETDGFKFDNSFSIVANSDTALVMSSPRRTGWLSRLWAWISRPFRLPDPRTDGTKMTVLDFFRSVKNSATEMSVVLERARGYERAIVDAKRCGQTALVERLADGLNAARMEAQCEAAGVTKSVREEDVVRFYKASRRGLRLDWVKNFVRTIPAEVASRKVRADALGVFDNYLVLHYDPGAKSFAETEAEREARRDPILFGVMKGKRVLYVVGDWVDEVCDLTLDELADAVGRGAVQTLGGPPGE